MSVDFYIQYHIVDIGDLWKSLFKLLSLVNISLITTRVAALLIETINSWNFRKKYEKMSHFPHYELDKNHIHIQPQIMGDPIYMWIYIVLLIK